MSNTMTVRIQDLKTELFVRASLDENRALSFAELMDGGTNFPPIIVTKDYIVVDGRHRIQAYQLLDKAEIRCVVRTDLVTEEAIIAQAYLANAGGSLPPSQEDTEHTIRLLLARRVAKKRIGDLLNLPPPVAKKYIELIENRDKHARIQRAVVLVTQNEYTVVAAANEAGADLDDVKRALAGPRTKKGNTYAHFKIALSRVVRSHGQKIRNLFRQALERYDDGEILPDQYCELLDHLDTSSDRFVKNVADMRDRFKAKIESGSLAK